MAARRRLLERVTGSTLAGRERLDRERVHRARQLVGQSPIDHPLAGDLALAGEGGGLDRHVEVALAAFPGSRMAGMPCGIVLDLQSGRRERRCELFVDGIEYGAHRGDLQFLKGNIWPSYLA